MALVNNGVKVSISPRLVPIGFNYPAYTPMSDFEYCRDLTLEVDRATVAKADKALTLEAILNNLTIGVEKQVTDIVTADYIGTNTVEYLTKVAGIDGNVCPSLENDFYTNVAPKYIVKVKVYIRTS